MATPTDHLKKFSIVCEFNLDVFNKLSPEDKKRATEAEAESIKKSYIEYVEERFGK